VAINIEKSNEELSQLNQNPGFISEFNEKIQQINSILQEIKRNNDTIKQINHDYERATLSSKEQGFFLIKTQ